MSYSLTPNGDGSYRVTSNDYYGFEDDDAGKGCLYFFLGVVLLLIIIFFGMVFFILAYGYSHTTDPNSTHQDIAVTCKTGWNNLTSEQREEKIEDFYSRNRGWVRPTPYVTGVDESAQTNIIAECVRTGIVPTPPTPHSK